MHSFRPNVAAILYRLKTGKILVCQRADHQWCWQFPQGGVDEGEDLIGALHREVEEEIGIPPNRYEMIACRTGYRYEFKEGHLKKGQWRGQEQTYFLCEFYGKKKDLQFDQHHQEFLSAKWIHPEEYQLSWVPDFKQEVFKQVFKDFFEIELS